MVVQKQLQLIRTVKTTTKKIVRAVEAEIRQLVRTVEPTIRKLLRTVEPTMIVGSSRATYNQVRAVIRAIDIASLGVHARQICIMYYVLCILD